MKQSFKIRHIYCREQKACYSWDVRKTSPYVPCIYSMLEPGKYFRAPFKKGVTHMKLKKKMKRMLEANLMNVILATEQQELKKLMIHFLETL